MTTGTKAGLLFIGTVMTIILMAASVVYGYTDTTWKGVYDSFTSFNGSNEHIVVQTVRIPRALIAACIGMSLAMAGVIMQTLMKNPLASPDILGINAGAGFFVVMGLVMFGVGSNQSITWLAFIGAALAQFLVFVLGSAGREGLTPMKMTLAGAAIAAMFSSITQGFLVFNEAMLDQALFWLAGSVQGRNLDLLLSVLPYLAAGVLGAMLLAGKLNVLAMGEDVARGLGLHTGFTKIAASLLVVLLAGGAVAVAGPIGFVGIIIPHIARSWIGIDHRWLLPFSGLLGAILLLASDIASRYIIMPQEVPVGVMTAAIGVPFFIHIARKGGMSR
ncbi:iron ABC transporter [Domibacillus antri]|uniref:Iron ABC transporter n=1 Tax=Domibacillus antri TaxID=1714264 RepID=A0A1Q8Q5I7_9BACI|nr:iron ABC transporter permease [Domibacillus antri]OLN22607.1 iron ABC transporter [Domibacillus antri]